LNTKPIVAIMYDFDKTLSPKNMQEYAFVPGIGMDSASFWSKCNELVSINSMDPILAYMFLMKEESEGKMLLTRDVFKELGKSVKLFDGVSTWFKRVNTYAEKQGLTVEHYIISSGLKEIIEGTAIAPYFTKIYAAEFLYNEKQVPIWPAMAVNYTSKTQFLFRINKGILDVTEHDGLNEYTPENKRRIPFKNMIYIGDGLTDVPCMKLCKVNGGHSIAVYQEDRKVADDMLKQGRVDFTAPADYSKGSKMEKTVFALIDLIKAYNIKLKIQLDDMDLASK
jgi:2-hydroxy-3-keto-5-methylthiopentenyl-1-phosphate phosphatase